MALKVRRIDPLTRADDLKRLFIDNERPEFPEWFDRAYPIAVSRGASAWILVDNADTVVGHISAFAKTWMVGDEAVKGSLLCNLMVDKDHRSFFPTAALMRRMSSDLRNDGSNFLYSNPLGPGAEAAARAAGLRKIANMNRFLFPIGHDKALLHGATGLNLIGRRLLNRGVRAEPTTVEDVVRWTTTVRCRMSPVTPRRHRDLYFMRAGRLDGDDALAFSLVDGSGGQIGAALLRLQGTPPREATVLTMRCLDLGQVPAAAAVLATRLRSMGVRRLNTTALEESSFAAALVRGGFVQRKEPWTIAAVGLTGPGEAIVKGMAVSDVEKIDVD